MELSLLAGATDMLLAGLCSSLIGGVFWRRRSRSRGRNAVAAAQDLAAPDNLAAPQDDSAQMLARYQALSEMTSDYTYAAQILADGQVLHEWMSDSFQHITGYTPDELGIHGLWTRLVHPDDIPLAEQAFQRILAGESYVQEFRIVTRDGQQRWLRELARPEFDTSGRVVRVLGAAQDITDQRRAEQALRESERNLRLIAENTTDCVFAYDMDQRLLYVNSAFETLTEYSVEELQRRNFIDYLHPDDRERMLAMLASTFGGASFDDAEYRMITRSGREKWCSSSCGPLRDTDGRQIGVQGRERDISVRIQADQERVLVERKLQEAQKTESLGVLAGGIAHDFNNLLQAIYGNVTLAMIEVTPTAPAYESLVQIESAAQRASELVQQLLFYAGKRDADVRVVDLNAIAREMTALLRASIPRLIQVDYQLDPGQMLVQADPTQIRQVVMNLVMNAAESIGASSGAIRVSSELRVLERADMQSLVIGDNLPAGVYAVFSVADDGEGMDAATIARIFEPFFTTKFTGRGLGLAAVLGIIRAHHGALKVASVRGAGTTFDLLLPIVGDATPTRAVAQPAAWQGAGTVLLIDDEQQVRAVTKRLLERFGFTVLAAEDGPTALDLFRRHADTIVCVLLDLMLPKMSGDHIFQQLRQLGLRVPVVLISGYSQTEIQAHFRESAAAHVLQKPFSASDLRTILQHVLTPAIGSSSQH